ncbi:Type V secretory pathway, adhesin AidA [Bartonella grahamii]|uniref:Type V secretory pathway, adhesin AidA n=1 Tax=Bartonella grahamii TaxID=33045 RepID=A0A336N9V4_BARGR|nr:autotransporter outer membrane beta-barrel domain-containing protein [Bartonella grahamii]SSZ39146.1 Type V secretory pathway, adhesin AidA [Bartonella grahamii]
MYKKSLLLYTAAMTVTLFGTHFNAYAANNVLKNDVKGTVTSATSGSSYDAIEATNGGEIKGENLIVTSPDPEKFSTGVASKDSGSEITLTGTTIVEKVKNGLFAEKGGKITSENLIINGTNIGLVAQNSGSKIELTGKTTIGKVTNGLQAVGGAAITSKDLTITLNEAGVSNVGVSVQDSNSKIELKGKTTIKNATNHGLMAVNGAIVSEDLTLIGSATQGTSIGIGAYTPNSKIELKGKTVIEKFKTGLVMNNGAAIKIDGASITASEIGASFIGSFNNSKNNETTLENVNISSADDDALMNKGINAEKSTVTLNNVTVTQANTGIFANDHSTITVSGGSFDGKTDGVYAKQGSTINLTGDAKITSTDGYGLHAEGPKSKITKTGGTVSGKQNALFAEKGGQIDATDVTLTTDGKGTGAVALGPDSRIELHGDTTINNTLNGLGAVDGGKITSENLTIIGGEAIDQDPDKNRSGVWTADSGSEITLTGKTTIENIDEGFYADGGSKIISGDLTMTGGESKNETVAVNVAEPDSAIELNGKTTIQNFDEGLFAGNNSTIKMINGDIEAAQSAVENKIEVKKVALAVAYGGLIDLTDVSVTAGISGLQFLGFSKTKLNESDDLKKHQSNEINLTNADIHVENGTGILIGALTDNDIENNADLAIGTANLKNSEIHADVLLGNGIYLKDKGVWNQVGLKEISNGTFTLSADQSTLEGRVNIAKDRNVHFDLKNNTTWALKISKNEKDDDGNLLDIAQRSRSDISTLHLDNSSIIFSKPTEEHYQTLHIGSGKPDSTAVYNATGDAKIYFNAEWSDGAAINEQKTDRLLINGDVSGTTSVYVTGRLEDDNVEANTSAAANVRGLSLIQVSGKAEESSFKLVNGYTTRGGLPDMYTLRAYGPDSSQGKANIAQNLFDEKNESFWDFRLQPELLGNGSGSGPSVIAPVAQTASYLVMPNALFYSGLTDMAKQNALLANIRTSVLGKEEEKQTGFFLYTYGSTGTLSSERGPLKYGYGADIRYAALQAGVTLAALEGQNTTTHFGLVGTYGQLSFTPKDIADAGKSTLDKWSLTAYGSVQHNNGFYVDTLLSYGILKGHIANALRGNTAKLNDAKMLSVSTTIGKEFATGMEGLTFEPQAQIAYQHLMFNTIEDADNFAVDMNNPSQWLIRVGGRLTKTISTENSRPMSFYGKVNLIKTFGDDGTIQIGRNFDLDPMGLAIEGGVGINAQLSHNFSLHGDVSYQQKLQKTGISGANFSGGIRYQF